MLTLANRVNSNIINWNQYSLVIIHVGTTNNVDKDDTSDEIMTDMLDLSHNIFDWKSAIDILVLEILPRSKVFPATKPIICNSDYKDSAMTYHPFMSIKPTNHSQQQDFLTLQASTGQRTHFI